MKERSRNELFTLLFASPINRKNNSKSFTATVTQAAERLIYQATHGSTTISADQSYWLTSDEHDEAADAAVPVVDVWRKAFFGGRKIAKDNR
jgi:hypothetical protein